MERLDVIIKAVMALQEKYLAQQDKTTWDIKAFINQIKPDLEAQLGGQMSSEVEKVVQQLYGVSDLLDANFS